MKRPDAARPGPRATQAPRRAILLGLATVVATATALTAAGPASAAPQDEGVIREAGSSRAVPNSYIVVLKDTAVRAQGSLYEKVWDHRTGGWYGWNKLT